MAPESVAIDEHEAGVASADEGVHDAVALEHLERKLTSHAAHIAAAEAQWLRWLGEYCVREGWASWGCSGPAQWLSWRCAMSLSTARDKVRVAMALRDLPTIAARFSEGRLSYSKVRALTRVATPATDQNLAELGVAATGAQLDVIVRERKKALGADQAAQSAWSQRSWRGRVDGEETMVFTLRVPAHDADRVQAAVRREVDTLIADQLERTPDQSRQEFIDSRGGWAAMCADAAQALLIGTARCDELPIVDVDLIVDTDHDPVPAASSEARPADEPTAEALVGGRSVAPAVGHRLCCDARVAALVEDSRGSVLGSGRRTRVVSRKLRRALQRRDRGHCRFPGCGATRHLHAHHIIHWINGGATELDNLILVCTFHHHVLHEGGWNVDAATHAFVRPDGTAVDPTPSERFRGSAPATTRFAEFDGPAPLAEAENEPFDFGLVLDSLAFEPDPALLRADAAHAGCAHPVEHGPPIPAELALRRMLQAHWARTADLPDRRNAGWGHGS